MAWTGGYNEGGGWLDAEQMMAQQPWLSQQGSWQEQQQTWQGWQGPPSYQGQQQPYQGQQQPYQRQQQPYQGQQQQQKKGQRQKGGKGKGKGKGKGQQQQQTQQQMMQMMMMQQQMMQRQKQEKPQLRFELNDRVVCNLGIRWIGGHVVGTDPDEEDEWCYLVKTDPHPGLESRTITVPEDSEFVCVQEVCFDAMEAELIKGAAPSKVSTALRFAVGDRVVCRVRQGKDRLENWCAGEVVSVNFPLSGELDWGDEDISGTYPSSVAYQVKLDKGKFILCHADNHTLIRREGLEPQTRVKGVSKRIEDRKNPDGTKVKFDHMTERSKCLNPVKAEDKVPEQAKAPAATLSELTEEQKKALFIE